jgi:ABC-2 type transport system permease protein
MRYVGLLLGLRLRLLSRWGVRKYTRTAREAAPVRMLLALVVLVWIAVSVVFPLTAFLANAARGPVARDGLEVWLAWAGTVSSVVIFAYSILTWIRRLTYANDLRLLLMTPVPPVLLLAEKVGLASLSYSGLLVLTLPGTILVGDTLHLGLGYDLMAFVSLVVLPVMPTCLAMLFVLAVLRWIPPSRARGVASLSGVVIGGATFIGVQLLLSRSGREQLSVIPPSVPAWLPVAWPGRSLAEAGLGHPAASAAYLLLSVGMTALVATISVHVAGRQFALGSTTYGEVRRRHRRSHVRRATNGIANPSSPVLRAAWGALWTKDWLTLRRDPVQLAQLAYPLVFVAFYVYRDLATGGRTGLGAFGISLSMYSLSALTAVLVLGSFVPMIVNREGRSLYLLALAPLSARSIFLEKWLVGIVPPLLLAEVVLVVVAALLGAGIGVAVVSALCIAGLVVALVGQSLAVHLLWPRLELAEARRQGSVVGGIISFVLDAIVALATGVFFATALRLWPHHQWLSLASACGVVAVLMVVSVTVIFAGPRILVRLLRSESALRA